MNTELREAMEKSMDTMEDMIKDMILDSAKDSIKGLPTEIDVKEVERYNEFMAFYNEFKAMLYTWSDIEDKRYNMLLGRLNTLQLTQEAMDDSLEVVLEKQNLALDYLKEINKGKAVAATPRKKVVKKAEALSTKITEE